MGYDLTEARLIGRTSNHNSARDDQDRATWNALMDEIEYLLRQPRFKWLEITASIPKLPVIGYGYRNQEAP